MANMNDARVTGCSRLWKHVACVGILLAGVLSMMVSCTTTEFQVEPETETDAMAFGTVVFVADGFIGRPFDMDQRYDDLTGIELTFINRNGDEFVTRTRRGYYYLDNVPIDEEVRLSELYYKRDFRNRQHRDFKTEFEEGGNWFTLESGTVTNLGILEWTVIEGEGGYIRTGGHRNVEPWFREEFETSQWLVADWKERNLADEPITGPTSWGKAYRTRRRH